MQRDLDYFRLLTESRNLHAHDGDRKLRLAIIADCAIQHLTLLVRALFRRKGINAEIYEGMFDAMELEVRNPASALYAFQPEIIVMLHSAQALRDKFYQSNDSRAFLEQSASQLTTIWESITSNSKALMIQSTLADPMERFFGNYDRKVDASLSSIVSALNNFIVAEARRHGNMLLLDLEATASWVGRQHWFDERLWVLGKSLCALDHLPLVAQNIVDVVLAAKGRTVKCIVLDLDNTLWGGVIGDDGLHGIRIGAHGDGEPFFRLQSFLKQLKNRGILLAVCSKNEEANARKPFHENAAMVLALDDIVVFIANWNNKPENIKTIQQELRIGFDSMLFLDDNPFERAAVRQMLPDVLVPELSDDPSEWVKTLCELNLFEAASFSAEDTQRSDQYLQEARRRTASQAAPTFEEFLRSLDMTIEVARFSSPHFARIAQLLQRSNQFNLCTRRLTETQCAALMESADFVPLYAKLADRFGDHGLISVVVLERSEEALMIRDWLMSCRVLARGVEQFMMNEVVALAARMGLNRVIGEYIPTAKNGMVRDFFQQFGFTREPATSNQWSLDVSGYQFRTTLIRLAEGLT